jgi:Na+-driven multidrug efflux pump
MTPVHLSTPDYLVVAGYFVIVLAMSGSGTAQIIVFSTAAVLLVIVVYSGEKDETGRYSARDEYSTRGGCPMEHAGNGHDE